MTLMARELTDKEWLALAEAAEVFNDAGLAFHFPVDGDLDDRERELFEALVDACRGYHRVMQQHR